MPIHPVLARELRQSKRLQKFFNSLPEPTSARSTVPSAKSKKKKRACAAPNTPPNT